MRQYEMEMALLAEAPDLLRSMLEQGVPELQMSKLPRLPPDSEAYAVHKRMPHIKEMVMMKRFEQRRDQL
jgi:hypothetical protein